MIIVRPAPVQVDQGPPVAASSWPLAVEVVLTPTATTLTTTVRVESVVVDTVVAVTVVGELLVVGALLEVVGAGSQPARVTADPKSLVRQRSSPVADPVTGFAPCLIAQVYGSVSRLWSVRSIQVLR